MIPRSERVVFVAVSCAEVLLAAAAIWMGMR